MEKTDRGIVDLSQKSGGRRLSVVVPAYNEREVLSQFHERLAAVLNALPYDWEVIYVNDGSRDATLRVMHALRANDPHVSVLDLSRNYGKEIALTAGLDYAHGDAVIIIDADLQDPPELIHEFVRHWEEGFDTVYAKRIQRDGETFLKKATAYLFYQFLQRVSRVNVPDDTGDFRLLSRRAVHSLRQLREQNRFTKGLFAWIGYPSKAILYRRDRRHAGKTKWNYWKLWNFALDGIVSFTVVPLKIATYIGLSTALVAFVYAAVVIYKALMFDDPVRGYPSLMAVVLFLGGVQLMGMGIIGEYLGRVFEEVKRRPLYFFNTYMPSRQSESVTGETSSQERSYVRPLQK